MAAKAKPAPPLDYPKSFEEMLAVSQSVNLSLLRAIPDALWPAPPPTGKGRSIAQLFAHIHNVRLLWLVAQKRENLPYLKMANDRGIGTMFWENLRVREV